MQILAAPVRYARQFFAGAVLIVSVFTGAADAAENAAATLERIRIGTVGTPNIAEFNDWYTKWLGLELREDSTISEAMARSWGTPQMVGRRYSVLSPPSDPQVIIRAVEVAAIEGYRPATTFGWNAFEIIVQDVYAARRRLGASPFKIIGEPRPLNARPSVHAMQLVGPGQEILYLTTETGDPASSPLPIARGPIGRLFIMVLGGPDILALRDFYADVFQLKPNAIRESRGQTVQRAWGGTVSGTHPITLLRLGEHGNSIELNGYVKPGLTARPRARGELPPGNAMASFAVPDLDALRVTFIQPATVIDSVAYAGARSATFIGPAGELTELIEERE